MSGFSRAQWQALQGQSGTLFVPDAINLDLPADNDAFQINGDSVDFNLVAEDVSVLADIDNTQDLLTSAKVTGANTTPNGTLTVKIAGTTYYLLTAASA